MKAWLCVVLHIYAYFANAALPAALLASTLAMATADAQAAEERQERRVRVDFTSKPEEASIIIDGELRGKTPLTLFDIRPGEHHLRFELEGYDPNDQFFKISDAEDGPRLIVLTAELTSVKGLLLITTDPEGCTVTHSDGTSFGETPRLITILDTKRAHRFNLHKGGYRDKNIEVRFNGRTPLVKHETLILDSGTLNLTSKPDGVAVSMNGIPAGITPLTIPRIPKGRVTLEFKMDGYETQKREVMIDAGDSPKIDITMVAKPGSLSLAGIPSDVRFYVNDSPHGKGPLTLNKLAPGTYSVRAEKDGYESITREITIGLGESISEEFRLESIMGRLEVKTEPSGAQIFIDQRLVGVTKPMPGVSPLLTSDILVVPALEQGEHSLQVKMPGYADVTKHPMIENKRTTTMKVKLRRIFKPNFRIRTSTGTYDVYFEPSDNLGDSINAEISLGVKRAFMKADIIDLTPLN